MNIIQHTFSQEVVNTVPYFEELGNPFESDGENLMAMHTKDIVNDAVFNTIQKASEIGIKQLQLFVKDRFIDCTNLVTDPIYQDDSFKKSLQKKRRSGQWQKVFGSTRIPADWKGCATVDGNKPELLKLLVTKE